MTATDRPLDGHVIAVAGASGGAGRATLLRLARGGATLSAADTDAARLEAALDATRAAVPGARISGQVLDLLDPQAARDWADHVQSEHGRVDGLLHLVGGWRGSKTFRDTDLADWDLLEDLLVRTLQHTSLAFHDALLGSPHGRFAVVSAAAASQPTAGNAAYAAAKAAAEAWTRALADSFAKETTGQDGRPAAAAVILVVKALLTPEMRAAKPDAKFAGYTPVAELADAFADLWTRPADELNGQHLWLTPRP
jgi:NAD(P)-dependent dehydrogenase (short-subunit alcohol dehydrogenase family)